MGYPVKFNWVLKIDPPDDLRVGGDYRFSKPGTRVYPVGSLIDLIDLDRQTIAKITVTQCTQDEEATVGQYTVVKIYQAEEKNVLTTYWRENI